MGYLILGIIILAAILIFGGYIVLSVINAAMWLMIAVDVNRIPILMNYCRSELDFGAVTMQWFKRTAKSPKYH